MTAKKWFRLLPVGALAASLGLAGCDGDDGADGADGADGTSTVVATTTLAAGEGGCENGGTLIETFLDANNDGVADGGEALSTSTVCNGVDAGSDPVVAAQMVQPESCSTCHTGHVVRNGVTHQEFYDELFQPGVVTISGLAYSFDGTNDVVTFNMTKNGADFDCRDADALSIYFSAYDDGTRQFTSLDGGSDGDPDGDRLSIEGTLTYDGGGGCTSTKEASAYGDLSGIDGVIVVYGQDERVDPIREEAVDVLSGAHVRLAKYPFAGVLETGGGVDYVSAANVTGCESCHTEPYFKHGYIFGDVDTGTASAGTRDFYTCKACHIDNGSGGHEDWQYMVDDPQSWANGEPLTAAQEARYAYTTRVMNDVHMSHAMEFPYPQSMANCTTCHAGKLDQTLSDANFTVDTCKSCHPVDGGTDLPDGDGELAFDTTDMALSTILANADFPHGSVDLDSDPPPNCNVCHKAISDGGIAPVFSAIHPGLDPEIYDVASGTKYADAITVTIESVARNATDPNLIDIAFSATGSVGSVDAVDIVPTVYVAAYGYDSKDFIISNHNRDADRNRLGEFTLDGEEESPYFSNAVIGAGNWSVSFDTSVFDADGLITDGAIRRLEVAIAPTLEDASGQIVGLNAPSVTYNLTTDALESDYFQGGNAIVNVATGAPDSKGCNSCHDQLATTFHRGNRGGNMTVCRMCHVVTSGGSHLEGQSRSIDSYVHAVHSFQAFDVDEVDFDDPVEAAHYEEHVSFLFPDFATFNCQACHVDATSVIDAKYNVPDQSKSMPGLLSPQDNLPGVPAPDAPEVVVGPAARACGGCHRAHLLNTGDVSGLASFNQHTGTNGYRLENDDDDVVLFTVIRRIMTLFE